VPTIEHVNFALKKIITKKSL